MTGVGFHIRLPLSIYIYGYWLPVGFITVSLHSTPIRFFTYTQCLCTNYPQSLPPYPTEGKSYFYFFLYLILITYICSCIYIRFVLQYESLPPYPTEVVSTLGYGPRPRLK